jgi:hypothetical protein
VELLGDMLLDRDRGNADGRYVREVQQVGGGDGLWLEHRLCGEPDVDGYALELAPGDRPALAASRQVVIHLGPLDGELEVIVERATSRCRQREVAG